MGSTTSQTCGDLQSNLRTLQCPINNNCPGGGDNVTPIITSISPNTVLVGSNNVQLTINGRGFGSSPTVNLPAGVTAPNGQGSTDSQILITVNVSTNATISPNSITVTANSQTSNKGSFTLDGPFYMTVQADRVQTCSGCTSAIERLTTYQVMLFSGSVAPASLPLGESYTTTGESCTGVGYPVPGTCPETNTSYFTDRWTMGANYTPAGCGYNITDHWQWCAPSPPRTVGTLTGYIHTNAVSINGVVNPPNGFITGTVINP
jgi:hypothetical protein